MPGTASHGFTQQVDATRTFLLFVPSALSRSPSPLGSESWMPEFNSFTPTANLHRPDPAEFHHN